MSLIPWHRRSSLPVRTESTMPSSFVELRHAMDRILERMPILEWPEFEEGGRRFLPTVDVYEEDDEIVVTAELPGMDPDDIDIQVSGNELSIHGEKRESSDTTDGGLHHCERRYGVFTRRIELPSSADTDKIKAEQQDGVLTIRVRKRPEATSRRIDVRAVDSGGSRKTVAAGKARK